MGVGGGVGSRVVVSSPTGLPANHFHLQPAVATLSSLSDGVCLWVTCMHMRLNAHMYKLCMCAYACACMRARMWISRHEQMHRQC